MLILSRRRNESVVIGQDIVLTVLNIRGDKVRLGIQAPPEVPVHRFEVWKVIQEEAKAAQKSKS
ncbi:MAG: carbon storage regulator CsrA [Candidatus Peribacteraceae bacterium]|nr:carbon storage regulator CsrA [Candidatus Peribacteraceae bacterium]